jgi:hypothetical protein
LGRFWKTFRPRFGLHTSFVGKGDEAEKRATPGALHFKTGPVKHCFTAGNAEGLFRSIELDCINTAYETTPVQRNHGPGRLCAGGPIGANVPSDHTSTESQDLRSPNVSALPAAVLGGETRLSRLARRGDGGLGEVRRGFPAQVNDALRELAHAELSIVSIDPRDALFVTLPKDPLRLHLSPF